MNKEAYPESYKIIPNAEEFASSKEKFGLTFEKEVNEKLAYFNKKPFKTEYKKIWFDKFKCFLTFRNLNYEPPAESKIETSNDLKTFIFDKNQIISRKVFSSHRFGEDDFAFGILSFNKEKA